MSERFPQGQYAIPRDVVAGQVIYGMAIDFYAYGQIAVIGADNDSIRRAARRCCRQSRLNRHPQRRTQYGGRPEIPRFRSFG